MRGCSGDLGPKPRNQTTLQRARPISWSRSRRSPPRRRRNCCCPLSRCHPRPHHPHPHHPRRSGRGWQRGGGGQGRVSPCHSLSPAHPPRRCGPPDPPTAAPGVWGWRRKGTAGAGSEGSARDVPEQRAGSCPHLCHCLATRSEGGCPTRLVPQFPPSKAREGRGVS